MYLLQEPVINSPMWTELVQAYAALLGIPSAIIGVFILFRKDIEKTKQVKALIDIAESQNEVVLELKRQVEQLTDQSGEFRYQSSLMYDQNKILEKQLDFQMSVFAHSRNQEDERLRIEKLKRINEIRPYFTFHSSRTDINIVDIALLNRGGDANKITLHSPETSSVSLKILNTTIEHGGVLRIEGKPKDNTIRVNGSNLTYQAYIEYNDADDNTYRQEIKKNFNGRFIVSDPVSITK